MKHQRKLAIAGVSGAMLVGAGTGLVLNLPSGAGAANDPAVVTVPPADTETDATTDSGDDTTTDSGTDSSTDSGTDSGDGAPVFKRGGVLQSSLDELVAAGTITQAQADAIIAGIEANRPAGGEVKGPDMGGHGGRGHGEPGMGGWGMGGRGMHLEAAATALGITVDELKAELDADKTIADVAAEKGIDVQTVIDAIVAEATANITERVTNAVNGIHPEKPADDDASADTETAEESTTTTD